MCQELAASLVEVMLTKLFRVQAEQANLEAHLRDAIDGDAPDTVVAWRKLDVIFHQHYRVDRIKLSIKILANQYDHQPMWIGGHNIREGNCN